MVELLRLARGRFLRPSAAAGLLTTDFDFTNTAPFEFAFVTAVNSRRRSGYD
jgi:hypothetical protein